MLFNSTSVLWVCEARTTAEPKPHVHLDRLKYAAEFAP